MDSLFKVILLSHNRDNVIGPFGVYAVAVGRPTEAPLVSFAAVSNLTVSQNASWEAAALAAIEDLEEKMGPNDSLRTFLSTEATWKDFTIICEKLEKKVFYIPVESAPIDFQRAHDAVTQHAARSAECLKLEFPMLPQNSDLAAHHEVLKTYGHLGLYNVEHKDLKAVWFEITRKKKLLLHVCCGPDAAGVIAQLKRDYELFCFWYDPNIQPKSEHDKRLEAFEQVAALEKIPYSVGEYDVERFYQTIKGLEHTPEQGAKCSVCYDIRLERAALEAKKQNCDLYTTTLAISPHKVQQKLKNFGEVGAKKYGVPYLAKNFMRDDGFVDSVAYTIEHNIYRQDYCGCYFSLHEGGEQARSTAQALGLTKDKLTPGFRNPFLESDLERKEQHDR